MKKKLVTALAGLIAMISTSFGAAQFSDVPAGHWALEAVDVITKCGLIVGYPDGTFRGNENLTRYQAALIFYRLLTQKDPQCGGQPGGMSDQDMMALRNAMQELAAELAALGVRVSALEDNAATKDDIARLEALIANAGSGMDQAALSDLADRVEAASVAADTALAQAQILADRLDALDGDLGALRSQVEADSDSIRALNELAVLLNQDVLSLQDRVTALEKSLGSGDLAAIEDVSSVREFATAMRADLVKLQDRVSALEANSFTISGWFRVKYSVYRAWSPTNTSTQQFDIDRVFGTTFSTGDTNLNGLVVDENDLGSNAPGSASGKGEIILTFKPRTAVSDPGKLNSYKDWIGFSITLTVTDFDIETGGALANTFNVSNATTTFKIADGQTLNFTFGRSVKLKFTEYLVDSDVNSLGHGFVANYNAGFAQLTGFYASIVAPPAAWPVGPDYYARGLRAKFGLGAINLGASFAQWGPDQTMFNGTALNPFTLWGLDAGADLGPLKLMAEYFNSSVNDPLWFIGSPLSYNGFYVKADGGFGPFTVGAHYRSISGSYTTSSQQLSMDGVGGLNNSAPYRPGYTGFGLDLKGDLGPLKITARYDSFADYPPGTTTYTAWSIAPSVTLGAFTFSGFYDIADNSTGAANEASMVGRAPGVVNDYYTRWGIGLAVNGLVPNLSLNASYKQNWVDGSEGYFIFDSALWATYNASFGPLKVDNLVARYHSNLDAALGNNYTTTKFAVAVSTAPMAMPLAPSFSAVYATRNTVGNIATTSESKWSVGVKFSQFLFSNSVFEVKYGSYVANNVSSVLVGSTDKALDATSDVLYDANVNALGVAGSVTGLYFTWTYWDLVFSYADFDLNNNGFLTHGQAFTISYKVTF